MGGNGDNLSRRDFFKKFLKVSAVAGATVATGKYFYNLNPYGKKRQTSIVPSYAIDELTGNFSIVRGTNAHEITRRAVGNAGGMQKFVQKGDKVLLKVNCAFARPSWMGATTSPEVVSEVIKLCYEAGAEKVAVTDNPINDPKSCFLKSGIGEAVNRAGGKIILPQPDQFRMVKVSSGVIGNWEVLYEPLDWCDKLIGIPTLKTHNLSGVSLAMKNWYGFFGGSRARFHQDIHHVIAELGGFITPTLVILDATRMLVRNGPTGGSSNDVKPGNTVAVSTDQLAIDSFGIDMLGLDKNKIDFIKLAESTGVGKSDYKLAEKFKEESM